MKTVPVERLERRRLWSAAAQVEGAAVGPLGVEETAPVLQAVRFLGAPGQATGVALTFSTPLAQPGATALETYELRGARRLTSPYRRTPLASASYDDTTRTVTLVPQTVPFDARRARLLTIQSGPVRSVTGVPLDGNGDGEGWGPNNNAIVSLRHLSKRSISYLDANHSRVRLRLTGPGRIRMVQSMANLLGSRTEEGGWLFRKVETFHRIFNYGEAQQLWVEGATADTVLTGTIEAGRGGTDATTSFVEIINPGGARLDLLNDPAFRVTS